MKNTILSAVWWKAATMRALRTALVIASPYVPTILYDGNYALVGSAALLGALTSFLTSLFNIPETDPKTVSWYWALAERVIKTAAQSLVTLIGTTYFFQDVNWTEAPQLVGTAVLGSLLLAFMKGMPESPDVPAKIATVETETTDSKGEPEVTEAPIVASVEAAAVQGAPPITKSAIDSHDGKSGV